MIPRPRSLAPAGAALLLVLSGLAAGARAGAWLQPVGGIYAEASYLSSSADERISCRGGSEPAEPFGGRYHDRQVFLYGEYGFRPWLTLVASTAVKEQRIRDAAVPDYGTRSTGDLRLGGRWALHQGGWPLSLETLVSVPTYPQTDLRVGVGQREQFLPAGSGELEAQWSLQIGHSLHPLPVYFSASVGRLHRGGSFGDPWRAALEVGWVTDRLLLKSDVRWSLPSGDPCGSGAAGDVANHARRFDLAPKVGWRVSRALWLQASVDWLVSGRNVLDGTVWGLSVAWIGRRG